MPDRVVCLYDFAADEPAALFAHRDVELVLLDGSEDAGRRRDELARATVVSVRLPLNDATRALLDADRLALPRPGVYLVNTGRGGVVDEVLAAAH